MAYALFANAKLLYTGLMNSVSLQQTQRSNEQYNLATDNLSIQSQISSLNQAQSEELGGLYELLAETNNSDERQSLQDQIKQKEEEYQAEIEQMNRQTYQVSLKENAIEMEVKRLDTKITALQKQLDQIQEAEGSGIDRSTPKFKGVG